MKVAVQVENLKSMAVKKRRKREAFLEGLFRNLKQTAILFNIFFLLIP